MEFTVCIAPPASSSTAISITDDQQAHREMDQLLASSSFQKDPDGWTAFGKDSEDGYLAVQLQVRGPVVSALIVNGLSESSMRAALERATRALAPRPAR